VTTTFTLKGRRFSMRSRYALLCGVLSIFVLPHVAGAAEKVTVGLDFTLSGYHAPWFVAQEKGYFAEQGLDVQLGRGYGSGDTVKKLATGANGGSQQLGAPPRGAGVLPDFS
jgi:ABC-type nitrate/sulfonate/bicarbonate transport system substrate-binding protein